MPPRRTRFKCNSHVEPPQHNRAWEASPLGMTKINVDASIGLDSACAAAICRDSEGQVIHIEAMSALTNDLELADAKAIRTRLKLAVARCKDDYMASSASQSVVKCILNRANPPWRVAQIVNECCSLLRAHTSARLEFRRRSTNETTHRVGRKCLSLYLYGNCFYPSLPSHCGE